MRERKDDLYLITNHFLEKYNRKFNKQVKGISSDTWSLFFDYQWPGNVRELENTLEHAFVCCHDEVITMAHLPADFKKYQVKSTRTEGMSEDQESKAIHQALQNARWNKSKAADLLGISRRTIYRKMEKYGLSSMDS